MPRAIASICRADNPLPCAWRAEVGGEALFFSTDAHGWVLWVGNVATRLVTCPGCGGRLPAMERLWKPGVGFTDPTDETLGEPEE